LVGDQLAGIAGFQRADVGDEPAVSDHRLDLAADLARHGDRWIGMRLQGGDGRGIHADLRSRAGDLDHGSDRAWHRASRLGRRGRRFILLEAADFIEEFTQVWPVVHNVRHSRCPV